MVLIWKERNCVMSEKKEIKKEVVDAKLEKTAGGVEAVDGAIYNFKCLSCGNIVMRGNDAPPKFPCPKCMKKEWEFAGTTAKVPPVHVYGNKE